MSGSFFSVGDRATRGRNQVRTMDTSPSKPNANLSDYLAAERTLLAWIRTGLALMGLGFVLARFGLFLRAIQGTAAPVVPATHSASYWFGIGLLWSSGR